MSTDNLNKYLTWGNAFKLCALVWGCVWFIAEKVSSGSITELELNQTKKDVSEIKSIVKEIQVDVKNGNSATDSRLDKLEQRVGVLETVNTLTPKK